MKYSVALALVAGGFAAGGASGWAIADASNDDSTPSTTQSTPMPSDDSTSPGLIPILEPSKSSGPIHVTRYAHHPANRASINPTDGVIIRTSADSGLLTGAESGLGKYIVDSGLLYAKAHGSEANCPDAVNVSITVKAYASNHLASGVVNVCGLQATIWGAPNGVWTELLSWIPDGSFVCGDLRHYSVPVELLAVTDGDQPTCYDKTLKRDVVYTP